MTLTVTNAGLAASLDAANKGIKLKIKKIGFGNAGYVPNKDQTSLKSEFLRTDFTDTSVSSSTLNMNVVFDDLNQSFDAKEIGYYLEDDTLFAVDSLNGAILSSKHKGAILTESFELVLSDNLIDSITVDVVGVSRATEVNVGIAKIATIEEAFDVENDSDIVTPKKMHDVLDEKYVFKTKRYNPNLLINGCFSLWQRGSEGVGNGYSSVDRWYFFNCNSKKMDYLDTGITDGTSHYKGQSYLRITSRASGDFGQSIERNFSKAEVLTTTFKIRVNKGSTNVQVRVRTMQKSSSSKYYDFVDKTKDSIEVGKIVTLVHTHTRVSDPSESDTYTNCMLTFSGVDTEIDIFEAKCELGDVATPFFADQPSLNRVKCKRYFNKIHGGIGWSYTADFATSRNTYGLSTRGFQFQEMRDVPAVYLDVDMSLDAVTGSSDKSLVRSFSPRNDGVVIGHPPNTAGSALKQPFGYIYLKSITLDAEI